MRAIGGPHNGREIDLRTVKSEQGVTHIPQGVSVYEPDPDYQFDEYVRETFHDYEKDIHEVCLVWINTPLKVARERWMKINHKDV